jgi:hypothetical protein
LRARSDRSALGDELLLQRRPVGDRAEAGEHRVEPEADPEQEQELSGQADDGVL